MLKPIDFKKWASEFKTYIEEAKVIVIGSHRSPDGDNLGSSLGLYLYLQSLGKEVYFVDNDKVPSDYEFLPQISERTAIDKLPANADLGIVMDCSDLKRMGRETKAYFSNLPKLINIDHHHSNEFFGNLNIVADNLGSSGEVLYYLLKPLQVKIRPDMATALYAAISSDTGSFQYDSVTSNTHRVIADLIDCGANQQLVVQNLYQSKSIPQMRLMGIAMSNVEFFCDDKIGLVAITRENLKQAHADEMDTEGIVEMVRNIDTVELAIFLKETADGVKISLRSKSYVNCTVIAEKFGGGGHIRASGGLSHDSIEVTREKIISYATEVMS